MVSGAGYEVNLQQHLASTRRKTAKMTIPVNPLRVTARNRSVESAKF